MNLIPVATMAALVGAGLSVTPAAPAAATPAPASPAPAPPIILADPNALGTYTFEGADGESATWTVTPCAVDALTCVHVAETGNASRAPWEADAYLTVGYWMLVGGQPDASLCGDGKTAPGLNNYSWDAVSLDGYASISDASGCGTPPENLAIPFALTKTGSGPVALPTGPVQETPYIVDIPEPYKPGAAEAPAAGAPAAGSPVENDPALKATPNVIPNTSDPLTEAEVASPGFNR